MPYPSILFGPETAANNHPEPPQPEFFGDLNLDQIVAAVVDGRQQYRLTEFFHVPLDSVDAITYRHDVMRDFQRRDLRERIKSFAGEMAQMRAHLALSEKLYYHYQKKSWWLDATLIYVDTVKKLTQDLREVQPHSRGLRCFCDHLSLYSCSPEFARLDSEALRVKQLIDTVKYTVHVAGNKVTVARYDDEVNYSTEVAATFEKFKRGAVKSYRGRFSDYPAMSHVEQLVLEQVARLYPNVFAALNNFCASHRGYLDESVAAFDREAQFYLAYLEHIEQLGRVGLQFCFPGVSAESKEIYARETFDLALAGKFVDEERLVVCNDFHLSGPERIFVVSGPNQGGKTTFARTFGQIHYLARLGLPVPGTGARLFLFDHLFSHFEHGENLQDLHGKLQDDLLRIRAILDKATAHSVIVINEIFNSTSLVDAVLLGTKILERIIRMDALCVCVTFIDELASLSDTAVSMASAVSPEDPAIRTFKVERRPADGLAYAIAVAEKYQLTFDALRRRITS
jgi:hypothetical protein